jgi:hypothetical protein
LAENLCLPFCANQIVVPCFKGTAEFFHSKRLLPAIKYGLALEIEHTRPHNQAMNRRTILKNCRQVDGNANQSKHCVQVSGI